MFVGFSGRIFLLALVGFDPRCHEAELVDCRQICPDKGVFERDKNGEETSQIVECSRGEVERLHGILCCGCATRQIARKIGMRDFRRKRAL